jgi:nucleoid-associated protein YgaU
MTSSFHYDDPSGAFSIDLGTQAVRLGSIDGLSEKAYMGEADSSRISIDDPDADVGNSGDAILGLKTFVMREGAAPAGNKRVFTGYIGARDYYSDLSLDTGAARRIDIELTDLNAALAFEIPHTDDANRPAETVGERITWLLASTELDAVDNGFVVYPDDPIDPTDYRGQYAKNVLSECAMVVGFNFFLYYDEAATQISLWFQDSNTSTDYSTDARLSNVLSECDSFPVEGEGATKTWAVGKARLRRDPSKVSSAVYQTYEGGFLYVERPATVATYALRETVSSNSNVKTQALAQVEANRMLTENATEDDVISVPVQVPAANVNDIRAGQRIEAHFRQLPGYGDDFHWFRVVKRNVKQQQMTPELYVIDLELSPMPDVLECNYDLTEDGTYGLLPNTSFYIHPSDGVLYYLRPGLYYPVAPTPGFVGNWHFGLYATGGVDYMGDCVQNTLRIIVVGNGTMTIQTETYLGGVRGFGVWKGKGAPSTLGPTEFIGNYSSGDAVEVVIDDAVDGDCVRIIDIKDVGGTGKGGCGGKMGYSSVTWVGV